MVVLTLLMNDIQIDLNPNTLYCMLDNVSTNNSPNSLSHGVLEKVYNANDEEPRGETLLRLLRGK